VIDRFIEILGSILTSLRAKVIFTIVAILIVMTCMMGYIWFDYWRNQLVELSLHHVQEIINKIRNSMIFVVFITVLVLSTTIAFLFEREVHTPISSIVDTMSEVEEGNLTARINLYREDELGLVARNLNSMLNKLESAIGELRKYHKREIRKSRQLAAVGELAASISHEIRNPLAGIEGAIQVILKDNNLSKRHTDVLNEVLAQVDRLNGTVGDLLMFSRSLNLDISHTDVGFILDRTLDPLKLQPYMGDTEIITDYESIGPVSVDSNLIEQALFNIIMNSLQSIDEKGRLKVTAKDDNVGVIISIEDNGCNISKMLTITAIRINE